MSHAHSAWVSGVYQATKKEEICPTFNKHSCSATDLMDRETLLGNHLFHVQQARLQGHTWMQLMDEAFEALEIWKALLRSTCPRKLVMMTRPSMAQSKRPGNTPTSG